MIGNKKYISTFYLAVYMLGLYVMVAMLAPIIANKSPLACKTNIGWIFPFLEHANNFDSNLSQLNKKHCICSIIKYSPHVTDLKLGAKSPSEAIKLKDLNKGHFLGTDELGRDVASGLIHGTKTAIQIGFLSVLLSFLIGVTIGMTVAYFKEANLELNVLQMMVAIILFFMAGFYISFELILNDTNQQNHVWIVVILVTIMLIIVLKYLSFAEVKKIKIDIDTILVKVIELRKSFPGLFILLALTGLFVSPSVWNIIFIITILGWIEFARFARAETLAVKNENYITAAKVLGLSHWRILNRHILPNILPTLLVIACFSVSSAILLESTLSFLGIGLPVEEVTWGKMMAEGRNMQRWWLVVFPGIGLLGIILCLNTIADHWSGWLSKES